VHIEREKEHRSSCYSYSDHLVCICHTSQLLNVPSWQCAVKAPAAGSTKTHLLQRAFPLCLSLLPFLQHRTHFLTMPGFGCECRLTIHLQVCSRQSGLSHDTQYADVKAPHADSSLAVTAVLLVTSKKNSFSLPSWMVFSRIMGILARQVTAVSN